MTTFAPQSRRRALARLGVLATAIALTTWGICLISFSGSVRSTRLGIPIAFWGALLGYAFIRMTGGAAPAVENRPVRVEAITATPEVAPRATAELVRDRDDAVRREYESQLEVMLRRELDQVYAEVAGLRRDVADLRSDVLDAVDGRLRMERVEITRIIGSNVAASPQGERVLANVTPLPDLPTAAVPAESVSGAASWGPIEAEPTAVASASSPVHPTTANGYVGRRRDAGVKDVRGGDVPVESATGRHGVAAGQEPDVASAAGWNASK
jgi:hypothetical protein